eukprot:Tbor_TRINITY_DN5691_c2_g7::TRINITY_DN5691_c2_g7_i1::g.8953::m.8953
MPFFFQTRADDSSDIFNISAYLESIFYVFMLTIGTLIICILIRKGTEIIAEYIRNNSLSGLKNGSNGSKKSMNNNNDENIDLDGSLDLEHINNNNNNKTISNIKSNTNKSMDIRLSSANYDSSIDKKTCNKTNYEKSNNDLLPVHESKKRDEILEHPSVMGLRHRHVHISDKNQQQQNSKYSCNKSSYEVGNTDINGNISKYNCNDNGSHLGSRGVVGDSIDNNNNIINNNKTEDRLLDNVLSEVFDDDELLVDTL